MISSYFGTIPSGKTKIERVDVKEPALKSEIRDTIYDNVQLPGVMMAYRIPAQGTKDFYAIEMMSKVLSEGESSRLNMKCVENDDLRIGMRI